MTPRHGFIAVLVAGVVFAAPAAADVFTLYPHEVVSSSGWEHPERALGAPGVCEDFASAHARDPAGAGAIFEVGGWDPLVLPAGHRVTRVVLNARSAVAEWHSTSIALRARGSVPVVQQSGSASSSMNGTVCVMAAPQGFDVTEHRHEWTAADVAGLIAGALVNTTWLQAGTNAADHLESFVLVISTAPIDCGLSPQDAQDFGTRVTGSTASWSYRFCNEDAQRWDGTLRDAPPFFVTEGSGEFSLDSGECRDVTVTFAPETAGEYALDLLPGCGPTLTGRAVTPATEVGDAPASAGGITSAAPNPFRRRAEIGFTLARTGPMRLAIHDVGGRLVRVIAAGSRPAGEHRVSWDGRDEAWRDVPAGLYFVRLTTTDLASRRTLLKLP